MKLIITCFITFFSIHVCTCQITDSTEIIHRMLMSGKWYDTTQESNWAFSDSIVNISEGDISMWYKYRIIKNDTNTKWQSYTIDGIWYLNKKVAYKLLMDIISINQTEMIVVSHHDDDKKTKRKEVFKKDN